LYLPAKANQSDYNDLVKRELATAANIKSKKIRNGIQSGWKSIQQRLKLYKNLPENGLALFAGTLESRV
jgi:peptide chain release factor subunit 1